MKKSQDYKKHNAKRKCSVAEVNGSAMIADGSERTLFFALIAKRQK